MNPHEALELAHADANTKISLLLRPYSKRAQLLGFKAFLKVEPETILANGEQVYARCVTIRLKPNTPKATLACKRDGVLYNIEATDRYVDLRDAEDCIAGVFEVALETARQAYA